MPFAGAADLAARITAAEDGLIASKNSSYGALILDLGLPSPFVIAELDTRQSIFLTKSSLEGDGAAGQARG